MQAVKDKLHDMNAMRKAKAEAKQEEKAEKEIAKARQEVAREVRLAKEAEAQMHLHVEKAGNRAEKEIAKHAPEELNNPTDGGTAASHHGHYTDDFGATAVGSNTGTERTPADQMSAPYTTPPATGAPASQNATGGATQNSQFL